VAERVDAALSFGISRTHGGANLVTASNVFRRALEVNLGSPVRLSVATSYTELVAHVMRHEIDLAWLPPLLHGDLAPSHCQLVAVPEREGTHTYRSCIFVSRDSRYFNLDDLRGVRAAWIDRASASGYLAPLLHLIDHGFVPARDLVEEHFHGRSFDVCAAVSDGRADFGACHVSDAAADNTDRAHTDLLRHYPAAKWRLRPLAVTERIPPDGVVLTKPSQRVIGALLSLGDHPSGRDAIQTLMAAERLVAPSEEVIAATAHLIEQRDRHLASHETE
jgi:ABC-type phosphate/phosphonate transport system substrate-binding protein